jgi:NADH:ubiquinone oxidoreductase subunit F (NADH-binding)/NADH:ubiquinone oxidoreductase subunit E
MSKNASYLSGRRGLENGLFEQLVESGKSDSSIANETYRQLAEEFMLGDATILGAASFYDFLREENRGKKAYVCNGTACLVAGTQDAVHSKLREHFAADEIGHVCCLGRCHENSSFQLGGNNYSGLSGDAIDAAIAAGKGSADEYPVASNLSTPLLTAPFPGVDAFYSLFKETIRKDADAVLDEIVAACIRGRGGAGFPAGIKWKTTRAVQAEQKYVVCNADEGDPGAYTDRYLMEKQPHLVLFGMMVAGYLTGADTGVLYIREEYPESVRIMTEAVAELEASGLLGEHIDGSDFSFRFKVIEGAGAYICGEETALLASLEGQRPEVRVRPPFPAVEGLFRKPTVLNNVETFALVPAALRMGGAEFAKIGTGRSTGSKLVSLDSSFRRPGVYEIEMGTPFLEVIEDFGGGFVKPIKAVQVGGPLGGVVPVAEFANLTLDFESFNQGGFLLGHASVVGIPEDFPMLNYIEHLFEFTAAESCGKCFPCRIGSTRGKELLEKARTQDYRIDRELLDDLIETMENASLCALGGGVPLPIRNILQHFSDELAPHFDGQEVTR